MSKFNYSVDLVEDGVQIVVTRLADKENKTFFIKGHRTTESMERFMRSVTDDQAAQYFPKANKK